MKTQLPNFLIVGAAKSGTSSLHNYLNQHPDIFMPSFNEAGLNVKEPHFFVKESIHNRLHFGVWNWESYIKLFEKANSHKAIGEASVFYLYYAQEAIENIKKYLNEDVKIIMILRNPVDRAYSAYRHVSKGLKENQSFEQALEIEEKRFNNNSDITPMIRYKDMGLYYKMVKEYLSAFKHVHIILHDDFSKNTESELKKIYNFLKIDKNITVDHSIKYNIGDLQWSNNFIKSIILSNSFLKQVIKKIFGKKIKNSIWKLISVFYKTKATTIRKETRDDLLDFFKDDIIQLSKLIKRDLSAWLK